MNMFIKKSNIQYVFNKFYFVFILIAKPVILIIKVILRHTES